MDAMPTMCSRAWAEAVKCSQCRPGSGRCGGHRCGREGQSGDRRCALETSPGILAALPVTLELHSMYMYARGQVEEGHQSRKRNDAGEVTPPPSPRSPSVSPKTISLDCPNGATGQTEGAGQSAGGGARARGRTDASALAKLEIFECGASVRSRPRPSFLPI